MKKAVYSILAVALVLLLAAFLNVLVAEKRATAPVIAPFSSNSSNSI